MTPRHLIPLAAAALLGCAAPDERSEPPEAASPPHEAAPAPPATAPDPAGEPVPEVRLTLDETTPGITVLIELDLDRPTEVNLLFRMDFEGYPDLAARLVSLAARGPAGPLETQTAKEGLGVGHFVIDADAVGRVAIEYNLAVEPPDDSRLYHRVSQIAAYGGHLLARDLVPRIWLGPPHGGPQPAQVFFSGLPRDWRVATVEPHAGTGYSVADIVDAVFLVGPLRQQQLNLGPRSLVTAVYGRWPIDDARIFDAVNRMAGTLHRIAGDSWARGDYLLGVGRVPTTISGWSAGGQVIGNSAVTCAGGSLRSDVEFESWVYTTAHELMHWYIPTGFAFDSEPPSWFAEGFTDYMALKTLLVGGLIDAQAFLDEMHFRWQRYRDSPLYGTTSIIEAEEDFWSEDTYHYIYDGGALAALLLDLGFQDRGGSLERSLGQLRRRPQMSAEDLVAMLASIRENEWISDWLATGKNPDWEGRLETYGLASRNDSFVSLNDWATNALRSIRP